MINKPTAQVVYIQPFLYEYRLSIVNNLANLVNLSVICSLRTTAPKCPYKNISIKNPLLWVYWSIKTVLKDKRATIVFIPAYSTSPSIVLSALAFKLFSSKLFIHGQALFKKPSPNLQDYLISFFWLILCHKYICYTNECIKGPFKWPFFSGKVTVINNRFENLDAIKLGKRPLILPSSRDSDLHILFIGRNREGSRLDLLNSAISILAKSKINAFAHLIGTDNIDDKSNSVFCYGNMYGDEILQVASLCKIGVYPGDAGLSALHYMALGLCPVVHNVDHMHSGPEPCYIKNNVNGIKFDRGNAISLAEKLAYLHKHPSHLQEMRVASRLLSEEIHKINYSAEIFNLIQSS